jgi:hypothetical protein
MQHRGRRWQVSWCMGSTDAADQFGIGGAATQQEPSAAGPVPLPRRGLLDRNWQKRSCYEFSMLASLALLWVIWQVVSPLLDTILLFALGAVLAFTLTVPVDAMTAAAKSSASTR